MVATCNVRGTVQDPTRLAVSDNGILDRLLNDAAEVDIIQCGVRPWGFHWLWSTRGCLGNRWRRERLLLWRYRDGWSVPSETYVNVSELAIFRAAFVAVIDHERRIWNFKIVMAVLYHCSFSPIAVRHSVRRIMDDASFQWWREISRNPSQRQTSCPIESNVVLC